MFSDSSLRWLLVFTGCLCLCAMLLVRFDSGYLTNVQFLGGFIFLEALAAVVWRFNQRFFAALVVVFLAAGIATPAQSVASQARWIVLAAGAIVGLILYLKESTHWFGLFHAIALSCVLSAFASAVASSYQSVALLKAASLMLLFLYGLTGARLALAGRYDLFLSALVTGVEALIYISAVCYLVFHYPLLGNPNSLGAIMGVLATPVMLWATLISGNSTVKRRRQFALLLSLILLLSSYSRASIAAAAVAFLLICFGSRQYKLFVRGVILSVIIAIGVSALVPLKTDNGEVITGAPMLSFFYKGRTNRDLLQSRRTVWDQTVDSIRVHPFFGTGFGTSSTEQNSLSSNRLNNLSNANVGIREHGNSYLAIVEWQGLLGVVPFLFLVGLLIAYIARSMISIRQTGNVVSPIAVLSAIMAAGLVHAGLEDWLFAVGYYLCIFFWSLAFMFVDVVKALPVTAQIGRNTVRAAPQWLGAIPAAGRR
jgi:O-antigen ligase